jgi:hypothetical protein
MSDQQASKTSGESKTDSSVQCDTIGCSNLAKFRCPTCIKLNIIQGSNFCSQVIKNRQNFIWPRSV